MALPKPPDIADIRKRFDYCVNEWASIREQAATDMRFATGDPWDPDERESRHKIGRLCLDFDELTQYINALVNGIRQNKRAPKVTPVGDGANDKTAEMLAGLVKAIGYKSNADAARITAAENAAMRSYGYYKIVREYISDDSDLQELCLRRVPNPNVIYLDPDAKEADFTDGADAFEIDTVSRDQFKIRWPKAQVTDFSSEHIRIAPAWIKDERIQIAAYWKAHVSTRTRLRLDDKDEPTIDLESLPEGDGVGSDNMLERKGRRTVKVNNQRVFKDRFIVEYITNGIEILETHPWTLTVTNPQTGKKKTGGRYIPIIPILGKEVYIDTGKGSERTLQSLIRMARTPYMAYCYTRTAQLEEIQLTSKTPYFAVEGQFENHENEVQGLNKIPRAVQYYKARTTETGEQPLGPPTRPDFIPNVQLLEVYAQACRSAIQAAIGFTNPQAQRNSTDPLSGKAQEEFEQQGDLKTFHFIDNYDRGIELEGRILVDLIPVVYDTAREVSIIGGDDKPKLITLNDPNAVDPNGQPAHYPTDVGDHEVTISVGPSNQSQRDESNKFSDALTQNPQIAQMALQAPGSPAAKLFAGGIRLKALGPIADNIADTIDPPQQPGQGGVPPQVQQAVKQMQGQLQQATAMVGHLQQELKEKTEIATLEMQNKRVIAADKNRTDMVVAALKAGVDSAQAQLDAEMKRIETMWDKMHESELAPGPDDGSQGIHPTAIPPPIGAEGSPAEQASPGQ